MSAACQAKKNTLPRIPGEWKTSGRPKGEKADNLSRHFDGEHDACSLHSGESWGEERESGAFSSRSGAFFFSSSHFRRSVARFVHPRARAYTRSASFLFFAFTAALSPFNLLIFSALRVKVLPFVIFALLPCESKC